MIIPRQSPKPIARRWLTAGGALGTDEIAAAVEQPCHPRIVERHPAEKRHGSGRKAAAAADGVVEILAALLQDLHGARARGLATGGLRWRFGPLGTRPP